MIKSDAIFISEDLRHSFGLPVESVSSDTYFGGLAENFRHYRKIKKVELQCKL